jgi:hypothetical protein
MPDERDEEVLLGQGPDLTRKKSHHAASEEKRKLDKVQSMIYAISTIPSGYRQESHGGTIACSSYWLLGVWAPEAVVFPRGGGR